MRIITIFLITLCLSINVFADWKLLEDTTGGNGARTISSTPKVKVEITIPDYKMKEVTIEGKKCVLVYIPHTRMIMKKGFPLLPKMTKLIKIDNYCGVKLKVLSKEEVEVNLPAPIVPSKGHLNRNINPATVPYEFGPIYEKDVFWPCEKKQFKIGKPFIFRDVRGVRVRILPIRVNHVQMKMKVLKKAVIEISCEGRGIENVLTKRSTKIEKEFMKIYKDAFLNYRTTTTRGTVPNPDNKKLVVVVPTKFESVINDWVTWKKKCGYKVTVHVITEGTTAGEIKSYLQKLYDDPNTRFGYVVLIGDAGYTYDFEKATPMPTFKGNYEGAAADEVYIRLAGNDNYPDAFISRISGMTTEEIKAQLDKLVAYEKNPPAGDWYTKGVCIASNQGNPMDKERAEWLQNGGGEGQKVPIVDGGLLGYGYTYFDDIYDPYASAADVTRAVNDGRSIICYIGHGSETSWATTWFSVSDVHNLKNGGMLPVIWSVACVNGKFVHTDECFAEAWLRKANGGAVAMEAASTNESWVPPCDKQAATINAIILEKYFTFGALECAGVVKVLEVWGDDNHSEGNKLAEQCNLFGDCTLLVRTKKPTAIETTETRGINNITIKVTSNGREVTNATVTVYSKDFSYHKSMNTDSRGTVTFDLSNAPQTLYYTVVGPNLIPIVDKEIK